MWTIDTCRPARLRAVIAMAAIATALAVLLAVVAHCGLLRPASPGARAPQPLLTSLRSELTVNVDHPYVDNSPSKGCRKAFADAALPRSPATAVAALGVLAAVVAVASWLATRVVPAGRDPPHGPANFLTGQDLLTRFCSIRR